MLTNMKGLGFFKSSKVFYGYWIVAVTCLCLLVVSGIAFYPFGLFTKYLEVDFGWGRGQIMTSQTILFLTMGAISPFIGRLVDRYGARQVMFIGASVAGLGLVLLSQMQSLWQFYASYAVVGIGMAGVGTIPTTTVVSNWFKKRRGTALGIMSTGIGIGGATLPLLIGTYLLPNFGWSRTYLVLALLMWILIPPVLMLIRTKPEEMGLYPDGVQASETVAEANTSSLPLNGLSLKMALTIPFFWLMAISYLTNGFGLGGISLNQVPHLTDIGFSLTTGATVLSMVGIGSLVGKLGFGWLCDRIRANYVWAIACSLLMAAIIMLMNMELTSPSAIIWLYAITMGMSLGGWVPTMSMFTSTNFGLASYGTIFGMLLLFQSIGGAVGPLIAGYMYDTMNTYHQAFVLFIVLNAVAISTALAIRHPKSLPNFKRG